MTTMRGRVNSLDPFEVFKAYQAIRLHFTSPTYSAIKYNFKTSASPSAFFKRNDKAMYAKVAKRYPNKAEMIRYLVANFAMAPSPPWIGTIVNEYEDELYMKWLAMHQNASYTFRNDCRRLARLTDQQVDQALKSNHGQLPLIVREWMADDISLITLLVMDKLTNFVRREDGHITDQLVWPEIQLRLRKTGDFVQVTKDKYRSIIKEEFAMPAGQT